jgi:hypothetical protein
MLRENRRSGPCPDVSRRSRDKCGTRSGYESSPRLRDLGSCRGPDPCLNLVSVLGADSATGGDTRIWALTCEFDAPVHRPFLDVS